MSLAEVKRRVKKAGFKITIERRLPDNDGTQIVTDRKHVVNVYDTKTVLIQGEHQQEMREILTKEE
jgi:hypothetical protein